MTEVRELRAEEIPAEAGVPEGAIAVGLVENGEVVALMGAFVMIFLDPIWVAPHHRGRVLTPGVLRRFWDGMRSMLRDAGFRVAVGHVNQSEPVVANLLQRVGAREVLGRRQFVVRLEE